MRSLHCCGCGTVLKGVALRRAFRLYHKKLWVGVFCDFECLHIETTKAVARHVRNRARDTGVATGCGEAIKAEPTGRGTMRVKS